MSPSISSFFKILMTLILFVEAHQKRLTDKQLQHKSSLTHKAKESWFERMIEFVIGLMTAA